MSLKWAEYTNVTATCDPAQTVLIQVRVPPNVREQSGIDMFDVTGLFMTSTVGKLLEETFSQFSAKTNMLIDRSRDRYSFKVGLDRARQVSMPYHR